MPKFVRLNKVEYNDAEKEFEVDEICINVDHVVYVESKVVHLSDGTSFLCKEDYDTIIANVQKP